MKSDLNQDMTPRKEQFEDEMPQGEEEWDETELSEQDVTIVE